MVEPASVASALSASVNAIVLIAKTTAHFRIVPEEVSQLLTNVALADEAIRIAQRNLRLNPPTLVSTSTCGIGLDADLRRDVERSKAHVENILTLLRESVESCRRDLELRGTVTTKNRVMWMMWQKEEFVGKLATLVHAVAALNRDNQRMEAKIGVAVLGEQIWGSAKRMEGVVREEVRGAEERLVVVAYPRSPAARRRTGGKCKGECGGGQMQKRREEEEQDGDAVSVMSGSTLASEKYGLTSSIFELPATDQMGEAFCPPLIQVQSAPSVVSSTATSWIGDQHPPFEDFHHPCWLHSERDGRDTGYMSRSRSPSISSVHSSNGGAEDILATPLSGTLSPVSSYQHRRRRRSNFI